MRLTSFKYGYVSGVFVGFGLGALIHQNWWGIIPILIGFFLHGPPNHMSQIETQEFDQKIGEEKERNERTKGCSR